MSLELWLQQQSRSASAWLTCSWCKAGSRSSLESVCSQEIQRFCAGSGLMHKYRKGSHVEFPNLHETNLLGNDSLCSPPTFEVRQTHWLWLRAGWANTHLLQTLLILKCPMAPTELPKYTTLLRGRITCRLCSGIGIVWDLEGGFLVPFYSHGVAALSSKEAR